MLEDGGEVDLGGSIGTSAVDGIEDRLKEWVFILSTIRLVEKDAENAGVIFSDHVDEVDLSVLQLAVNLVLGRSVEVELKRSDSLGFAVSKSKLSLSRLVGFWESDSRCGVGRIRG